MTEINEVYSLIMPLHGDRLLLPNSAVAEVIARAEPEPVRDAPDWLLGELSWQGWRIPLVSFEQASQQPAPPINERSRIAITYTLGQELPCRQLAIRIQGHPQLVRIQQEVLTTIPLTDTERESPVLFHVRIGNTRAYIPDLELLEDMIYQSWSPQKAN
ncbi:MAG: chemotaxis protein CheW [Pseudomonadota bacterium]|nr:chemotaxis protein CheW [Pseudomonadota bacterium]